MTTFTVDGDVLPPSQITDVALTEARHYATARCGDSVSRFTLLRNAWLAGWLGRRLPLDKPWPAFAQAHAAGLAHRRAAQAGAQ